MPTRSEYTVNGVTLVVRVWPAAQPSQPSVVLLPATAETAEDWDHVASVLHPTRTVYAVNLRGHGDSDWPGVYSIGALAADVASILQQLDDGPLDLVGHSLGGLVASLVAAANPELVSRLVLEDVGVPHPRPPAPPSRPEGVLPFDWRLVEQVRPEIDDPDPQWGQTFSKIAAPTLVIAGGTSSPVPKQHIVELTDTIAEGRHVTIDAGHLVHASKPHQFTRCLLEFLDR